MNRVSLPTVLPVSIAALILFWQLILPPPVGVANNSDFGKLLGRYNLGAPSKFEYADTRYVYDPRYHWESGFYSSESLLILPALAINRLVSRDGSFDLRLMGIVHGTLFLVAMVLFVPLLEGVPRRLQLAFWAMTLFIFCDVMYVSYLNSFYMDVAAYLSLLLAVVLYLRVLRWRRPADIILLVVCCAVLITSKPQHAVLAGWLALLFWVMRDVMWGGRKLLAATVSLVLLVTAWATLRFGAEVSYAAKGYYTAVFWQILPNSKNVDRAMADLGLDDSYRVWIGTHAYYPGTRLDDAAFSAAFMQKVSYGRLAWFYLTHPPDAYRALLKSLAEAGRHRPMLGNFDPSAGKPAGYQSQSFAAWSDLKKKLFLDKSLRLLLSFTGLALLVTALLVRQRRTLPRGAIAGGIALVGMTATEMLVSSLADAIDVPRHHLIFYAHFDLLLLAGLWLLAAKEVRP